MHKPFALTKVLTCLSALVFLVGASMAAPRSASASINAMEGRVGSDTSFTKVLPGAIQSLDPHMVYDVNSFEVLAQVYESLLTYQREDPETMVPLLAESWDILDGGTTYTFTLRGGVAFHEGGELEAHDVAYSFWRGMLKDSDLGAMSLFIGALFGVNRINELPGDDIAKCTMVKNAVSFDDQTRQVVFHLQAAYAPLASLLTTSYGAVLD